MVSPLIWVGVGVLVYSVIAVGLKKRGKLPSYIKTYGPLTTIHTQRGKKLLDKLAQRWPTFWRYWGDFGVILSLVVMVGAAVVVIQSAILVLLTDQQKTVSNPKNMLVIPGVNDFLPLAAAPEIVFGLAIGLVIHEGGHGLYCRYGDIEIESLGLVLLALVPAGAFVEPDDEESESAPYWAQLRMFAAGVTNNIMFALVLFVILFAFLPTAFTTAPGVPVGAALADTPAETAGIGQGDLIQSINGTEVSGEAEMRAVLRNTPSRTVTATMRDGETVTVTRQLLVRGVVAEGGDTPLQPGVRVTDIDGESVVTTADLYETVDGKDRITLTTENGQTVEVQTGAYIRRAQVGGPLNESDLPASGGYYITEFDGTHVASTHELLAALQTKSPGETVSITVQQDGQTMTREVTLGAHPRDTGEPFLGVTVTDGVGRIEFTDFGIDTYPAATMLELLKGEGGLVDFGQYILLIVFLPLLGRVNPEIGYSFAGFVGDTANYYTVVGPLEVLGGGAFTLFNLVFWSAWINIQLGFVNCIPSYPLDGGHILRAIMSYIAESSRIPLDEDNIRTIALYVTALLLALLAVTVFA